MKTLYVSDLDGTLLGGNGHASEFTVKAVNSLIDNGLAFTFATARSVASAAELLKGFKMTLPAVMMNGVFLTDIPTKTQIHACRIPVDTARKVIDIFESCGRPPFVYTFGGEYIEAEYTKLKSDHERSFVAARKKVYRRFAEVENYTVEGDTVFISGIDNRETMEAVTARLQKVDGIKFSYYLDVYGKDKYYVEVYHESAGKQNGVKRLKEMYGFDRVVAFGDNENDVEVLKSADTAVVVKNGQPMAKEVADVIIDTNDNDGVAKYLLELYEKGEL